MKLTARKRIEVEGASTIATLLDFDYAISRSFIQSTLQTPQHLRDSLLKGLRLDPWRVLVSSRADLLANFLSLHCEAVTRLVLLLSISDKMISPEKNLDFRELSI